MTSGGSTYIPLKVNQSGVIPIIFASSVLYLPQLVVVAFPASGWGASMQRWVNDNLLSPRDPVYLIVFGLLIIGFAYFYTAITFDPVKQADTLRKQGGFIPGIRPGPQTERYLGAHPVSHHFAGRAVPRHRRAHSRYRAGAVPARRNARHLRLHRPSQSSSPWV